METPASKRRWKRPSRRADVREGQQLPLFEASETPEAPSEDAESPLEGISKDDVARWLTGFENEERQDV